MLPINVLSCFDGLSAGQIALQRAGIPVNKYYASEIDEYCLTVVKKNFPDTVQLGDVHGVTADKLPTIDLLLGGSPCTAFSITGHMLGFTSDTGKLFFHYSRILNEVNPKWFLFENVSMKPDDKDVITRALGVEPIVMNSSKFSAQQRKRLYWTNIPFEVPAWDSPVTFTDILEYGQATKTKAYCLMAKYADKTANQCDIGRFYNKHIHNFIPDETARYGHRMLTAIECERLQTYPDNYTDSICNRERLRSLGNSWTVDAITHILKHIVE